MLVFNIFIYFTLSTFVVLYIFVPIFTPFYVLFIFKGLGDLREFRGIFFVPVSFEDSEFSMFLSAATSCYSVFKLFFNDFLSYIVCVCYICSLCVFYIITC